MTFYTRDELESMSKLDLINLVSSWQNTDEQCGENKPTVRKKSRSKFSDIDTNKIVDLHLNGLSIADITKLINDTLMKAGDSRRITNSGVLYKIKMYEAQTGLIVYKPAKCGRKPNHV
mgnify:CR=1 FL=1